MAEFMVMVVSWSWRFPPGISQEAENWEGGLEPTSLTPTALSSRPCVQKILKPPELYPSLGINCSKVVTESIVENQPDLVIISGVRERWS